MLAAFAAVALPLAVSVCIETVVAALFGFRRRELTAVVWVNFVTNPVLNLVWLSLFWLGFGHTTAQAAGDAAGRVVPSAWMWSLLVVLEVVVIVAEWRLLLVILGRIARSSRRLLTVSVVMNAVSATLGTFLLGRLI